MRLLRLPCGHSPILAGIHCMTARACALGASGSPSDAVARERLAAFAGSDCDRHLPLLVKGHVPHRHIADERIPTHRLCCNG